MKFSNYAYLCAVAFLLPLCKTETETPKTETKAPSLLCDGNGTSEYFPLKLNNRWDYVCTIDGELTPQQPVITIGTGFTMDNKAYLTMTDSSTRIFGKPYFYSKDSANNVIAYESFYKANFVEVPSSPKVNSTWTGPNGSERKVVSVNASVKTPECNYSGLLQIYDYPIGGNSKENAVSYYKKGLGLVYFIRYGTNGNGDTTVAYLKKVSLK